MSPRAENKMGRWGAVSYFVGNIVGSGIFIVPSTVVQNTGSVGLALLIFPVLSAAIALLGAFCYVELGTCIRRSGGDFAYLCHVRWNAVAFMFMAAGCIIIYPIMLAVQAETFAEYVVQGLRVVACVSETHEFLLRKLFSFLVVWLILFLNFFSTRRYGARFQIWSSLAKLLSTGVIVGTAAYLVLFKGQTQNFRDPFANSTLEPAKLVNAFFAGLFSFDGWDVLNFGAEEVENPRSTMVFAIIVGMLCVTTIYATINISYFVVLDALQVRQSTAVAMSFAEQSLGHFQNLMPFLINLVMIGALNGTMFTASRYLFAAARQRHLPSFIALVNVEHDSPRAAVVTHTLLAFFISFLGNIDQLINYLGFAQWLQRGFTMGALLWIRLGPGRHILHPDGIRTPLIMPIAFLLICLTLVGVTLFQDFDTAKYGLMVLAVALAVHCIFVWEQSLSRFSCYRQMASQLNDWFARITQLVLNGQIDVSSPEEQEEEIDAETFVEKRRAATLTISHGLGPAADHQQTTEKEKGNKVFPVDGEGQRRRQKRLAAVNGDGPTANSSS